MIMPNRKVPHTKSVELQLSEDEATLLYDILGSITDEFNRQGTADCREYYDMVHLMDKICVQGDKQWSNTNN